MKYLFIISEGPNTFFVNSYFHQIWMWLFAATLTFIGQRSASASKYQNYKLKCFQDPTMATLCECANFQECVSAYNLHYTMGGKQISPQTNLTTD